MDVTERLEALRNNIYVKGKYLSQIFPQSFLDRHLYHKVRNGCCIQCNQELSPQEEK